MTYKETINKINESLQGSRAAISEVCRRADQHGRSAYYNALKKNDWNELSVSQRKVINVALDYIKDIKGDNPDPIAMKAEEILR